MELWERIKGLAKTAPPYKPPSSFFLVINKLLPKIHNKKIKQNLK